MTTFRRLVSPADAPTWVGRILGLFLLLVFGWMLWQLAPMIVGDLVECVPGVSTWCGR